MASEKIVLQAKVKRLGYTPDQYRNMSEDDLRRIISKATKPADKASTKGSATKGSATKGSANGAVKGSAKVSSTAAKGSTAQKGSASTSAPAKSKSQKSGSVKGSAAKGTAKRPTAAAAKGSAKSKTAKGSTKAQVKTGTAKKTTAKKAPARKPASKGTTSRKPVEGRATLRRDKIDWTRESSVGASPGKRMDVMKKLRQFEGDSAKVFKSLRAKATTYYPTKTEHEAERTLVWLINRVAYDFAYKSGQHEPGTRAAYGTSTAAQDVRRREQREEARKAEAKAERARKRGKTAKAGTKGSKTKAAAKKKAAAKGKSRKR